MKSIYGLLLIILVPLFLSPEEQRYWFTIMSLATLVMLAGLGFSSIITQFVAHEFAFPYFEMSWHLFSDRESNEVIDMLRSRKPKFLFVDTNMGVEKDMWDKLYPSFHNESAARRGRNNEMNKVFMAVSDDYEKVEEGSLITVYKRK